MLSVYLLVRYSANWAYRSGFVQSHSGSFSHAILLQPSNILTTLAFCFSHDSDWPVLSVSGGECVMLRGTLRGQALNFGQKNRTRPGKRNFVCREPPKSSIFLDFPGPK